MTTTVNKPTPLFWIISVLALVWNAMGVLNYLAQAYMTPEMIAALPDAERVFYENIPAWTTAAFAIAVFGGTLGALLLLLRKKLAQLVFILSLLGVLAQMSYFFIASDISKSYGPGGMVMPIMIVGCAVFLIYYAKKSIKMGWIS